MTYALTSFINRALRWCSDSYFTHVTSVIDIIITFTEPLWCYIWHCSLPPSLIHLPPPLLLAPCRPDRSQFTQPHTLPTLPPPLPSSPPSPRCGEVGTPSFIAAAVQRSVSVPAVRAERRAQRHAEHPACHTEDLRTVTGFQSRQERINLSRARWAQNRLSYPNGSVRCVESRWVFFFNFMWSFPVKDFLGVKWFIGSVILLRDSFGLFSLVIYNMWQNYYLFLTDVLK